MLRTQLMTLIRAMAEGAGFTFGTGFPYRIGRTALTFPALWLEPLQLAAVEGRAEGRRTYRATLYLMVADRKYDAVQKEARWAEMEEQALTQVREQAWHDGVLERVEVEFFPPPIDSARAATPPPAVKRIVTTTLRTQNNREAEARQEQVETAEVRVQAAAETSSVQKKQQRVPLWPWLLAAAGVVAALLLLRKIFRF